jgi:hypothetical protein
MADLAWQPPSNTWPPGSSAATPAPARQLSSRSLPATVRCMARGRPPARRRMVRSIRQITREDALVHQVHPGQDWHRHRRGHRFDRPALEAPPARRAADPLPAPHGRLHAGPRPGRPEPAAGDPGGPLSGPPHARQRGRGAHARRHRDGRRGLAAQRPRHHCRNRADHRRLVPRPVRNGHATAAAAAPPGSPRLITGSRRAERSIRRSTGNAADGKIADHIGGSWSQFGSRSVTAPGRLQSWLPESGLEQQWNGQWR